MYHNQIAQLIYNFPLDMVTSSGAPFWSGPKRPPTTLAFSTDDPLHMEFIVSAANLRAFNYGLKGSRDLDFFKRTVETVMARTTRATRAAVGTHQQYGRHQHHHHTAGARVYAEGGRQDPV